MMSCRQYSLSNLKGEIWPADLIILLVDKLASYRVLEKERYMHRGGNRRARTATANDPERFRLFY